MQEYKGKYYNFKKDRHFYEHGAHFKYSELFDRLQIMANEQMKKAEEGLRKKLKTLRNSSSMPILPKLNEKEENNGSVSKRSKIHLDKKMMKNLSIPLFKTKKSDSLNKIPFPKINSFKNDNSRSTKNLLDKKNRQYKVNVSTKYLNFEESNKNSKDLKKKNSPKQNHFAIIFFNHFSNLHSKKEKK